MDIIGMNQDTVSFHHLYDQYSKDVYRFSYWLSGDADEAKDITSETFVRVWTSTNEIRVESVKAYLFTIARNLYLQSKRKKKRFFPLEEEMRDAALRPDQAAEVRSELDEVLKALQTLSEIDRTVLIMRTEDELSYEEISRSTGLSISAVKVKVFRARAKLYSLIKEQRGEHV
jgi:RNA polymerase sigma-70 factor (ECF subfamily)